MENYLYLGLLVFTLSYPLAQSFESRISYYKHWYALFPAIFITAMVFILWDHWFTLLGVWEFNPRYVLGIYIWELPLEEISFFFIVPYACIFIYEVSNYFFQKDPLKPIASYFVYLAVPGFLTVGFLNLDRLYTSVNFLFAAVILTCHFLIFRIRYLGRILLGYAFTFIPFFLVNGILTGSFIEEPIVRYNNEENLSIRIGTVPVEDSVYLMSMLLMIITIYEKIKENKTFQKAKGY